MELSQSTLGCVTDKPLQECRPHFMVKIRILRGYFLSTRLGYLILLMLDEETLSKSFRDRTSPIKRLDQYLCVSLEEMKVQAA